MVFKLITLLSLLHLVLSRGAPGGNNTQNGDVAKDGSDARSLYVIPPITTCEAAGGTCMSEKKAMKTCSGTKSSKFECSNEEHICCINGCPDGFFQLPHPANQCLKFIDYPLPWEHAAELCAFAGLELAKPLAPVLLREYLTLRFGSPSITWLQAKGDGSNMVWADGQILGSTSPMWNTAPIPSADNCLLLLNEDYWWNATPEKPYLAVPCTDAHKFLCEVTLE